MKDEGQETEVMIPEISSGRELEEVLEKYQKRSRREPNFFATVILSCFTCCTLFYVTTLWVKNHEFLVLFFVPLLNSFMTTWYYNSHKDFNPFSVFFLSILPTIFLSIFTGLFSANYGFAMALLSPFILPVVYLGGILGGAIGTMTNEYDSMFRIY